MSEVQEYKATAPDGTDIFFVERSFYTAYEALLAFMKRNQGKGYRYYRRNTSSFGPTWVDL